MIADAEAAENCGEWHDFLVNDLVLCAADSFQVAVGTEYIASFVPAGRKYKADEHGQTTWSSVTRLKLTEIRRR
ncbi:hypothetical protein GFL91_04765 [Rhizobium leguminosarum bv. viciae]|uniref:Uncharacterized protein n=1 Tax=Rhizobium leguminosarum bv. viciae TaxID=387 RepID=A0A8I2KGX0_RHILV|nr:hypothetical protein [Rhizobium leguminosarum]NKM44311.1 hypothetical protein [Rhizobium leguminosarum bv. viciae]